MRIVVVGGSSTNVGKTTLACQLLQSVPSDEAWAAMKVSVHGRECPTRVAVCSGRDDDERHTDTQRLLDAGARFVVWVTVWRPHVRQGLAAGLRALRRLPVQGVVIESTSAGIELRRIAASWFVAGTQPWKPWAWRHLVRADAVVTAHGHGSWAVPTAGLLPSHAPEADVNLLPSGVAKCRPALMASPDPRRTTNDGTPAMPGVLAVKGAGQCIRDPMTCHARTSSRLWAP